MRLDVGEPITLGPIAAVSTLPRSTVSRHLKILHTAGVWNLGKIGK
jgi:DNA-binding transcriptional ArsR family regulator